MKLLKRLLATLLLTIIMTTVILWALAKSVNPEVVKAYVSTQLANLTHQNSKVEGDISWHVFPRPGIKITNIQIGDESNSSNYSVRLENLFFNLKITPLLGGKFVFNEFNVDGFKININPDSSTVSDKVNNASTSSENAKSSFAQQFAIERFLLSRGQINIIKDQRKITLSGLQIGAEQFNLQKRLFPLQFKNNIELVDGKEKILKAHINFKGSTSLSPELFKAPLTALQNTPLDGQLSIQNVKIKKFKVTKISAHTKTKPGILFLNPLTITLYDGESVGDLNYEFATSKLIVNQTATNVDSSKFFQDLVDKTLFSGSLDFSIHAQTNLQSANWHERTSGNGSVTIKDGVLQTINLDKVVEQTSAQINHLLFGQKTEKEHILELGQFNNPEFFKGGTNFKLLTCQYQLKDEKLESNSLVLQTDKLQLKGDGTLNLSDEKIDSRLYAKATITDSGIDKIQQLLGGSFPVQITGTLTEPSVSPDIQKINPMLAKLWIKSTLSKPVKEIGKAIKTILQAS
ncbi:putative assembly protein [Legionella massiliensis]|uniref:Putative assembly protein n=1 Tax=Legionella massiliensis TaxID=1034943 RepID=A0A078L237_9GAMM|nr:AsmA family protein [Legionella massiliensis]CDZ78124.1 putative assembly protein [Legionella massiliensis]CEE13862.1 putative assembly protein [Legionella massiliensis]